MLDRRLETLCEVLATALVFAALAAAPAPDVNETHYLTQAKRLWDPAWCQGDLLLDANKAHAAFFWLLGWPTRWLTLAQYAWTGRLLTWLFQAWGFTRLVHALTPARGWAPIAALLFLGVQQWTMFAGEWVVGGFEAKPLAYGCVLLALACAVERRWGAAAVWIGAATALHPLVGGWAAVGLAGQWLATDRQWSSLAQSWVGLTAGFVLAMCGIAPALLMDRGVSADVAQQAHEIYVYQRLRHHLDPAAFRAAPTLISAVLTIGVLLRAWSLGDARRSLWGFVAAASLIAVIGFLIRGVSFEGPQGADLLRFYWFRLADFAVPLGVVAALLAELPAAAGWRARGAAALVALLLALPLAEKRVDDWRRGSSTAESMLAEGPRADWRDACAAAARLTPSDALFVTPRNLQTFKWRAGRGEVATWKDVPQTAAGLVEWRQRLDDLHVASAHVAATKIGTPERAAASEELAEAARRYGATYVLRYRAPRLTLPVVYENATFAIYRVPATPK